MPEVTRDTFKGYDVDSKLNTLFDYQVEANDLLNATCRRVDNLESGQKRWKLVSGTFAAASGFFGGATTMVIKFFVGK